MAALSIITPENLNGLCDDLALRDKRIQEILDRFGYPPFWHRGTGFDGLTRIILEQQVSLASALSVFQKLESALGRITPSSFLALDDEALRGFGFSRQKAGYVRGLARDILENRLDPEQLARLPDDEVRTVLKQVRGIGDWTADIYLLMGLHRPDVFPPGDLALVKAMVYHGFVKEKPTSRDTSETALAFAPLRSVFAVLLWHAYIVRLGIKTG